MSSRRNSSSPAAQQLHGLRLATPLDALAALRASTAGVQPPFIAALFCDADRRLELTVTVTGASVDHLADVSEYFLRAVDGKPASLVIGVARATERAVPTDDELAVVYEVADDCEDAGVDLIDVIVLSGSRWWSARDDECL